VFLPLIALSEKFAALCNARGIPSEHVDGSSPDRKEILARFGRGDTRLLSNAMLLTEGYDEPSVDCVVMLRPTKVRSLYSQIIGRGTRLSPGKDHLLLLDFLWLSQEHSLISPAHLIAGSAEEADAITEALALGDGDLEEAKQKVDADRAASLRERLRENSKREARTFDALEFALSINEVDIAEFQPTMRWHEDEMTPKQRDMLLRYGIAPESVRNKGQACAILDKVFTRMDLGLASAKQVRWLRKLGHPQPELATFAEAKAFLDQRWNGRASGAAA
jgi:superfamily II DNA or RNA helicase